MAHFDSSSTPIATVRWDLNGNLIDDGTNSYSWDSRNQLTAIRDAGGTIGAFTYDPLGRRASWDIDGVQRGFVYDGWNVLKEENGGTDATLMNGLGLDHVFSRTVGSTTRTVLADLLGSTVALADDAGAITDEFAYGPFGETDSTVTGHPYQYTGRENDGTGLYHYRNRYYSPQLKRFISEDPIGMTGSGTNYYAYVRGDPLGYTDPLGLFSIGGAFSAVSQFSAGMFDGATRGYASRLFGVDPNSWCSSAHSWGTGVGAAGAGAAAGVFAGPIVGAAAGGGLIASSIAGGAIGGAYTAAGLGGNWNQIAQGAVAGAPGGLASGSLTALGAGTSAAGWASGAGAATGFAFDTSIAGYRLTLVARDAAGNRSRPVRRGFVILRG